MGPERRGKTALVCPVGASEPPVQPWKPRGLPRDRPGVQNSPTGLWEPKKHSAPRAAKKKWKKKWRAETTGSNPGNAPGAREPGTRDQGPGRPPHRHRRCAVPGRPGAGESGWAAHWRDTVPENARPGGMPRETRGPEPEPISMLEERAGPGDTPGAPEAATRRLGTHVNGERGETLCIHTGNLTPGEGKAWASGPENRPIRPPERWISRQRPGLSGRPRTRPPPCEFGTENPGWP